MAARSWGAGGARVRGGRQPGRDLDEARPDRGPGLRPATLWGRAHFPAEWVRSEDPAHGQKVCFSGFPAPELLPARGPPESRPGAGWRPGRAGGGSVPAPGRAWARGRLWTVSRVPVGAHRAAGCGPTSALGSPTHRPALAAACLLLVWVQVTRALNSGRPRFLTGPAVRPTRVLTRAASGRTSAPAGGARPGGWDRGPPRTPPGSRVHSSGPSPAAAPHLRASLSVQKMGRRRPLLPPSPSNQMPRNASEQ